MKFQVIFSGVNEWQEGAEPCRSLVYNEEECRYEVDLHTMEDLLKVCRFYPCVALVLPTDGGEPSDLPLIDLKREES